MEEYGSGMQGQMRKTTDEYGNPIGQTREGMGGEYGSGGGIGSGGAYGTTGGGGVGGGVGGGNTFGATGGLGGTEGMHQTQLHRSGSGSSSSSEDDGQGGRRKKGIKEKIKEKLPGGQSQQDTGMQQQQFQGSQYSTDEATGEKKGMMDKIKEKIPGMN